MARSSSVAKNSDDNSPEIRPFQTLSERLWQLAEIHGDEFAGDIMRDTVDRIAVADSPDAIFDAMESGPNSLRDAEELLNKPVALDFETLQYVKSAEQYRKNNLGVFVIIAGMLDNGEDVSITTGAPMIVSAIARLQSLYQDKDLLNGYRVMFKSKQTSNGNNLLLMVRAV